MRGRDVVLVLAGCAPATVERPPSEAPRARAAPARAVAGPGAARGTAGSFPEAPPGWARFAGGTFPLGAPVARQDDYPAADAEREVKLAPFMLAQDQVTVGEWGACVRAGVCDPLPSRDDCGGPPEHPANCVSHPQAEAYCASVGARLPTEEEWERAARGGTRRAFAWGDTWKEEAASHGRHPVGSHPATHTPEGLHDMAGNGREWTSTSVGEGTHVTRGIECPYALSCTAFNRFPFEDDHSQHDYVGVRCARDLEAIPTAGVAAQAPAPPPPRPAAPPAPPREVHWSTMSYELDDALPPSLAGLPRIVCGVEAIVEPDGRVHDVRSTSVPRLGIAECPPTLARVAEGAVRRGDFEPFADAVHAILPVYLGDPSRNMTARLDAQVFAPAVPPGLVSSPRAKGAPAPGCTVEVTVLPEGRPEVGSVYHCASRFHDAARRAAGAWRWRPRAGPSPGTIRVLFEE